ANVVVDPHRAREVDVETRKRIEETSLEHAAGEEAIAVVSGNVLDAGQLQQIVGHLVWASSAAELIGCVLTVALRLATPSIGTSLKARKKSAPSSQSKLTEFGL